MINFIHSLQDEDMPITSSQSVQDNNTSRSQNPSILSSHSVQEITNVKEDNPLPIPSPPPITAAAAGGETETTTSRMNVEDAQSTTIAGLNERNEAESSSDLSAEQEASLANFVCIANADVDLARSYLESTNWDLGNALSLFLAADSQPPEPTPAVSFPTRTPASSLPVSHQNEPDRDNPLSSTPFPYLPPMASSIHRLMEEMQSGYMNDDDEDMSDRIEEEYDEEGVRRPDPVRIQRLIPQGAVMSDHQDELAIWGRAEDPSIDWMFPPATHLSSYLPLDRTLQDARREGRYVLVNLQSHEEFISHLLNRDVWRDETIESLLKGSYQLWQRGHTSAQGKEFMRFYHIQEDQLPVIMILHPATGAMLFSWTGLISPEELASHLVEFSETHPLVPAPTAAPPTSSSQSDGHDAATGGGDSSTLKGEESRPLESVTLPPPPPSAAVVDYGPVPAEPDENDSNAVKISLRLPGKAVTRRYLKTDRVRSLFAVTVANIPEATTKPFELFTRYPLKNLVNNLDQTLEECELANSQVAHRWL
eukprot:scaffold386_cov174-Ochromonas_danica.AAC.17